MAFPTSPTNGQTYTSGGKIYTYNSTKGVWAVTANVPFLIADLNAVSAAVNVVSTAISNEISVRTAASAALETHANTVSAAVNVVSTAISNEISVRAAASAALETHANAVSAAVVVASALATTADNHANTVSVAVGLKADIASPTFTGTVTAATVTLSGELRGPASFTIDPAAVGDNTGVVVIKGDLQVDGTTTTVNSTTMSVADKNIVLASGAANAAAASGAGLTVNGPATPATFTYVDTDDSWNLNKKLSVTGTLSASSGYNGTVGATTPATGAFTTLSASGNTVINNSGTAVDVGKLTVAFAGTTTNGISIKDTNDQSGASFLGIYSSASAYLGGINRIGTSTGIRFNSASGGTSSLGVNGTDIAVASSTGLAVTGTLSASGTTNIGGSSRTTDKFTVKNTTTNEWAASVVSSGANASESLGLLIIAGTNDNDFALKINSQAASPLMNVSGSGNLGLGVTPSAWSSPYKAVQLSAGAFIAGRTDGAEKAEMGANAYYNSGWKYLTSYYASRYVQDSSIHTWYTATSGTAGNAITFTAAMTLDASGKLGIGTTAPTNLLHVHSTVTAADAVVARFESQLYGAPSYKTIIEIGTQYNDGSSRIANVNTSGNASDLVFYPHTGTGSLWIEALRLTSAGNVGIGTTLPTAHLDISTSDTADTIGIRRSSSNTNGMLKFTTAGTDDWILGERNDSTSNFRLYSYGTSSDVLTVLRSNGNVGIGTTGPNSKLDVLTSTAGYAAILTNTNGASDSNGLLVKAGTVSTEYNARFANTGDSTTFMAIKGNGNVGIGTSTPGFALEIQPTTIRAAMRVGPGGAIVQGVESNQAMFSRNAYYDGSWRRLNADFSSAIRMYNDPGDGSIAFHIAASGGVGATLPSWDSTDVKMVIRNNGSVGIGTISPGYKLDVNGTLGVSGATVYAGSAVMTIGDATRTASSSTTTGAIVCGGGLGVWATVNAGGSGNFADTVSVFTQNPSNTAQGVLFRNLYNTGAHLFSQGAATTNTYISWINGNGTVGSIAATGSGVAYNTSSDYRLKNTIAPMTGALDKVALLKPCTYKWNVDGSDGQGFIAHELQAVEPGCVTGEKDGTREEEYEITPAVPAVVDADGVETTPAVQAVKGTRTVPSYQGVDTSFLVATLTAAIQELKAIIDTQATRIAALESK